MPRKSASGRRARRRRCHSERSPAQQGGARNPSGEIPRPGETGTRDDSPGVSSASSPPCTEARGTSRANARELAEAVFAKVDPVKVGRELLEGGDAKGGSVRARVWEKLLEYRYGRPPAADSAADAAGGAPLCVRIISHIPRPQRDDNVEAT